MTTKLYLVLLMAFVSCVVSEDFCQAFKDNGNQIDYLYYRDHRYDFLHSLSTHFIIIRQNYWRFNFVFGDNVSIEFDPTDNGSAPLFTNKYFGAACLWTTKDQSCETLLFPKDNDITSVDVITIPGENHSHCCPVLSEFKHQRTAQVSGLTMRSNFTQVYPINSLDLSKIHTPKLDFAVRLDDDFYHMRIEFTTNGNNFIAKNKTDEIIGFQPISRNAFAVSSQWGPKYAGVCCNGFIELTNDNLVIRWCFRIFNSSECLSTEVLVDCSQTNPTEDYTLLIIIIATIAVLLVLVIVIVVCVLFKKSNSSDAMTTATGGRSAVSGVEQVKTKRSQYAVSKPAAK